MAMGKQRRHAKQASMWGAANDLPRSAGHPFYARLHEILDQHDVDGDVEGLCQRFYADDGRPGLPPGRYCRLLLIGYFEDLDAERAIAWRAADSFALRECLGLVLPEAPPDHSTISRTRRLIDLETHEAVFTWMLPRLADAGLVKGKTVGIDATTLEANAALRSIVRRDTGELPGLLDEDRKRLAAVLASLVTLMWLLRESVIRHRSPVQLFPDLNVSRWRNLRSRTSAFAKRLSPRAASGGRRAANGNGSRRGKSRDRSGPKNSGRSVVVERMDEIVANDTKD
jgi:transposase